MAANTSSSMQRGEAYYRDLMLQMQSEFARAFAALEKQITCLTAHTTCWRSRNNSSKRTSEIVSLKQELEVVFHERQLEQQQANGMIKELQEELMMAQEDFQSERVQLQTRDDSITNECDALKMLLRQEQDYWTRFEKTKQTEVEAMNERLAEAKADARQSKERNDSLCREIKLLQNRVDAAVRTSRNFEHRLKMLSHQKQDEQMDLEAQVHRLKRKVSEKREQNKYLSEELAKARADAVPATTSSSRRPRSAVTSLRSPMSSSSMSSGVSDPATDETYAPRYHSTSNNNNQEDHDEHHTRHRRDKRHLRTRDIALTLPAKVVTKQTAASQKDLSYAPTSPTASSPDMTPPTTPHKNDNNSRHRVSSGKSKRVDQELSDLRRKLNACMQFDISS
uniref:Uncharacterized protein n=1 Tax=Globisporangium ultimum (strain ATCC 200006 / CBS 805.95 / DAOM BR144) TaxID=431595 RepID=K3X3T7_GLOUD